MKSTRISLTILLMLAFTLPALGQRMIKQGDQMPRARSGPYLGLAFTFFDMDRQDAGDADIGWDNSTFYGVTPTLGFRLTPRLAVEGSYVYFFSKEGEAEENNDGDGFTTDWDQSNIQAALVIFPFVRGPMRGLHGIAGFDWSFFSLETSQDFLFFETNSEASGDAIGFLIGLGYDFPVARSMDLGIDVRWSSANYEEELFEGEDDEEDFDGDWNVGGWFVNVGFSFYFQN